MAHLLIKHTVQDYAKWRPIFDGDAERRNASGCTGAQVFRDAHKPNDISVLMSWDSLENAQRFVASPKLREAMGEGGIIGHPDASFLNEVDG